MIATQMPVKMYSKKLSKECYFKFQFTICTLVNKQTEYSEMIDSFIKAGFTLDDCEYIFADNTISNEFEGYNAINRFLKEAQGKYIILCHQDILLSFDDRNILNERLSELQSLDTKWAVCGNGGGVGPNHLVYKVAYTHDSILEKGTFPTKVYTLDENFILIKNTSNLSLSSDLTGFHLYGTDICIIAEILGYSCYVIDFKILHKSRGNKNIEFEQIEKAFRKKYTRALRGRFIQTTITRFYISGSYIGNFIFNLIPVMFVIRMYHGIKKRIN